MGEVYRAHDARLGRDVALKVVAGSDVNEQADARFEREVRAIAGLSHPNICAVYDVGSDAGQSFFVMELLEGETLQQRLVSGAIDVIQLVEYAIALTDALDVAHTRGVMHRDLKPANIFLTRHGQLKVLDFGLAKALEPDDASAAADSTRAADVLLTRPGTAVGTVAYMSPEQLRAQPIDARSDIFSLGAVLYEMATGRRAFEGTASAVVSSAILSTDPPASRSIRHELPAKLDEAISKALEKDPDLRYQTAADIRIDLKRLKRQLASDPSGVAATPPGPAAPAKRARIRAVPRRFVAAAVLVLGGLGATGWWYAHRTVGSAPRQPTDAALQIQRLTLVGNAQSAAVSPDGKFIAYVRDESVSRSVWVRQIATNSDVQVVAPVNGRLIGAPTVTPDGTFVDFAAYVGGGQLPSLWRVPFLGGEQKQIANDVWSGIGWSLDGKHMAFVRANIKTESVIVADPDGTNERVLATRHDPDHFASYQWRGQPDNRPSWSEDGKTLFVIGVNPSAGRTADAWEIVALDTATGRELTVTRLSTIQAIEVAAFDGTHVLVNHGNPLKTELWTLDLSSNVSVPLTRDLAGFRNISLTADRRAAVSTRFEFRSSLWIGTARGDQFQQVVEESAAAPYLASLDAAGDVVYAARLPDGDNAIYRMAAKQHVPALVTKGDDPLVTQDGRFVVFRRGDPERGLFRVKLDGSGPSKLVDDSTAHWPVITPDGRTVYYASAKNGSKTLWSVPLEGGAPTEVAHRYIGSPLFIAPDGRRGLFSGEGTAELILLCDLPGCSNIRKLDLGQHGQHVGQLGPWTPDGKAMTYLPLEDHKNIWAAPIDGGAHYPLTHFTEKNIQDFSFSPDGKQLIVTRFVNLSDVVMIKGFR